MRIKELSTYIPITDDMARDLEENKEAFQDILQTHLELMFAREVKSIVRDIVRGTE